MRTFTSVALAFTLLIGLSGAPRAQAPVATPEMKEAMAKLAFLAGKWQGDAVFQMGPQTHELKQEETVESRLDGLVLVVEGKGTSKVDGKVYHHALATISYQPETKNYRVVAFRQDGNGVIATGMFLPDGAFQWGFEMDKMTVRYTIRHAPGDTWHETGEISFDKTTWKPLVEMQLKRAS